MRAIWTGTVAFGLVSVPVKLYSATKDHDISLHQVHDADGGRIRYQRRCEVCGKEVDYENIQKAYDDGDDTVVLTAEELDALPARDNREIEVVQFVPDEQLDPMTFEKSYYLAPASKSPKAYILLRRTLEETSRTAIVKFAMRSKTRLAALRVRDDVIVVQTLMWADEVRAADFETTREKVRISARELKMARSLVDQFSEDYEPERFVDEYQEQLEILIQEKLEHGESIDTDATFGDFDDDDADKGGEVIDLMEALKRSVDEKRQAAKSSGKKRSRSTSAKKAGTRKKSAQKTAAGKTATGKTSTKQSTSSRKSNASKTKSTRTKKSA